jgi:predicted RND superfamily exporter protein
VHAAYTGSYVYALEDSAMLRGDIERYTVLALFGVLASFFIGYGNLRLLPYLTVPLLVATLVDFALSILLFDQLNASSLAFAAILYGLSIDSGIHFYTRLLQCPPDEGPRAVTTTLRALGRAHVGAATTTAAAFFLIGFSELVAVRQLGIMSGIGMLLTTVQFFTLYPALGFVMLARGKVKARTLDSPLVAQAGELAVRWRRTLVAGVLTLAVGLAFVARNVEFDASLDHLRPQDSAAIHVERDIAKRFSSQSWTGAVLVRRPSLEAALVDSEAVAHTLDELKTRGTASAFQSITAVLPSERTQRERLERYEKLPRADATDWLRTELASAGFALQPFAPFLDAFREGTHETVRLGDPVLAPFEPLIARQVRERPGGYTVATYVAPAPGVSIETLRAQLDESLAGVDFVFASRTLLEHELHAVMKDEMAFFFVAAIVVNYALLLLNGAAPLEAIGLLFPTVFALELLMAGMVVFGVALDPVNVVIVALVLGLGVDYGCFTAAAERERGGWGPGLRHCGRAVILTWLTTVVGFGFLAPSHYPALARLGQLATVGLSLSLVMAMTLIPALLSVLRARDTASARPIS